MKTQQTMELIGSYRGFNIFIFELFSPPGTERHWALRMYRGECGCIIGDAEKMTKDEAKQAAISLARETADAIIAQE